MGSVNDLSIVQRTVNSLSLEKIWLLWKDNICFEGVYLDTVLKEKVKKMGGETRFQKYGPHGEPPYFDEYTIYNMTGKYHHISYLWANFREVNKVSARLKRRVLREVVGGLTFTEPRYVEFCGQLKRELNEEGKTSIQIEIITHTNEYSDDKDVQFVTYENMDKKGLSWGDEVKDLKILITEKTLADNRFIDVPITCFSCTFLLRILLNPYSFAYESQQDGTIWLNKCTTKYKTDVIIPSIIDGKRVSRIGKRCFYNCKDISSVIIPEGVISIGAFAFDGCLNLKEIFIPKSVNKIGRYAFCNCVKLESVDFEGLLDKIYPYTFFNCRSLKSLKMLKECKCIGYRAFDGSGVNTVF